MKKCLVCGKKTKVYKTQHLKQACRHCIEDLYDRLGIDIAYDDVLDTFYEGSLTGWYAWATQDIRNRRRLNGIGIL